MTDLIEKVAEAIAISGNGGTWDDWYNEDQKEFHRKRARAAIAALEAYECQGIGLSGSERVITLRYRLKLK
jgi:hypothetical protein